MSLTMPFNCVCCAEASENKRTVAATIENKKLLVRTEVGESDFFRVISSPYKFTFTEFLCLVRAQSNYRILAENLLY
jgi:hypothetical protein